MLRRLYKKERSSFLVYAMIISHNIYLTVLSRCYSEVLRHQTRTISVSSRGGGRKLPDHHRALPLNIRDAFSSFQLLTFLRHCFSFITVLFTYLTANDAAERALCDALCLTRFISCGIRVAQTRYTYRFSIYRV